MRRASMAILFLFVAVAKLAPGAESGWIGGLSSGLIYDAPSRSIRSVVGAPGAAYLGEPLVRELEAVWLAPDGDQALAIAGGAAYWLKGLRGANVHGLALPPVDGAPVRVVWAADSSAALVYAAGRLTRVEYPGGVTASFSTDSLGGPVSALALAAGGAVLVGVEGVGLYRLVSEARPVLLAPLAEPSAIVVTRSDRLLVADRAREEILEIRNWREQGEVLPFGGGPARVSDPAAMAASPDGQFLLVASSRGRKIAWFDLASGASVRELPLEFEPTRLEPLGDETRWLLTERRRARDVLEVLADDGGEPAVFFIPAPSGESAAGQE